MRLVVPMFVVSGAAGLVDQLCYSKYLGYVLGSTAYAVSAVLAAFMAGLSLGAHLGGRFAKHVTRPLLAYGVLELVVCGWVAISPFLFLGLTPLYATLVKSLPASAPALAALRWLLASLIVLVPTTAMGATLPVLSRAFRPGSEHAPQRQKQLGALYAANTFGGALGALGAAYLVLPALGIAYTLFAAALVSGLVGVVAIWRARSEPRALAPGHRGAEGEPAQRAEPSRPEALWLLALALLSGWLVFSSEVVFTHLLALIIGNSVYAFGLILAIFLCCLFFGAATASRAEQRLGDRALPFSMAATALSLAVTLPIWDRMPEVFSNTGRIVQSFAGREAMRALVAFVSLAVPVSFMGLTFPLLLQRAGRYSNTPELVGRLTAINTVGSVVGALLAGYLLLPVLGSERSMLLVAGAFAVMALSCSQRDRATLRAVGGLSLATLLAVVALPRWDMTRLTAGSNVYFEGQPERAEVLFSREDVHGGVTTVTDAGGVRTLFTNGKFQGNTGWEMSAQRYFAHYPSLFVDRFEHALVIGLGTGTTTGTLAQYPWRSIDVVEISPAIVEAAQRFFGAANLGALSDDRVSLRHADGRNYLLLDEHHYDLISIELSSIWFAGASSLYSQEFYQLVSARLTPNGIFQQWVQLHHIHERDFATIIHTLRQQFKHVALFYGGGQGILVSSQLPLRARLGRAKRLSQDPKLASTLPVHPEDPTRRRALDQLLWDVLVVDAGIDAYVKEVAAEAREPVDELLSTDDNLCLEYRTPRGNVLDWDTRDALVKHLAAFRSSSDVAKMVHTEAASGDER